MISNEEMEKLWWQYKNEGISKNLSMQTFCSIHNLPYNAFEKYLKLRRHFSDVHHITVTDLPEQADTAANKDQTRTTPSALAYVLHRKISLHTSLHRGAKVRAKLRSFVETCKLE